MDLKQENRVLVYNSGMNDPRKWRRGLQAGEPEQEVDGGAYQTSPNGAVVSRCKRAPADSNAASRCKTKCSQYSDESMELVLAGLDGAEAGAGGRVAISRVFD